MVALEKSPQKIIGGPKFNDNARFVHSEAAYFKGEEDTRYNTAHHIEQFQTFDSKAIFVPHILQNGVLQGDSVEGAPYLAKTHCFVYNVYAADALAGEEIGPLLHLNSCLICMSHMRIGSLIRYGA
ncbi:hypothetical protein SAMN03159488_01417 [Pseudomonas sp. NFIX10]|nr:hypothetical protein SAMN03159488_01417 [Pseudomonas sp. NFIX10]SFE54253.1 hypothetical protein SAMN03159367_01417 [Pseudomonas sp. NFACC06-1]